MPIYMDRHDVSDTVTAEKVAQLHQEDLKIQHKFNCRGLTYWFDEQRKTAFCLVEAPDKQTVQDMHNHAHGVVPHQIIEVDVNIVESFLGRIEDPDKSQNTELNIINDPTFRVIMVINLVKYSLIGYNPVQYNSMLQHCHKLSQQIIQHFDGRLVKQQEEYFLISFKSVSKALLCAFDIQKKYKECGKSKRENMRLHIGINGGVPVTEKEAIFEDTIKTAEWMSVLGNDRIVVSEEIKALYQSENTQEFFKPEKLMVLTIQQEKLLERLMVFTEQNWQNTELKVDAFYQKLGLSKSQLYRKMMLLCNMTPNGFLKDYRLSKALGQLDKKVKTISEIAFDTGFGSPSYFSKCFQNKFGCVPSAYQS